MTPDEIKNEIEELRGGMIGLCMKFEAKTGTKLANIEYNRTVVTQENASCTGSKHYGQIDFIYDVKIVI